MSEPQEVIFDWSQAASLLGDDPNQVDPDMAGILRELVDGAKAQFDELKSKDFVTQRKEVGSLAHALRGCLLNFGFTEVGTTLHYIEKGPCTAEEFSPKMAQAEAAFEASKKMLAERYPSVGIS